MELTGDSQSQSISFGAEGDTVVSGCHLFSTERNSLAVFTEKARRVTARDIDTGEVSTGHVRAISKGDLLGCGDLNGDGLDELIFLVAGSRKGTNAHSPV
jgi:hypothetical protein